MPCFNPRDLQAWSGGEWRGGLPSDITGICHDSRVVKPGVIYVALKGNRCDGHAYLREAFERGAVAAMVQAGGGGGEK
ncbi:MAG: UDP-N-acetylmuramoyl-tripeptide--D-alanyl-D-alanine ligase, partial [Spartobacteria bacterium]|nr:UDP-N-acetylmuramoyl-tripeptide--D-alanyl-D-alanine ligase [Spartobacteria bacterium]